MRSPALSAYLAVSRLSGPAAKVLLRRRLAQGKEDASRLGERLGRASLSRPRGRLAWLHAASVGEATSALPLVDALRARGLCVLVTTGTVTSANRMAAALPPGAIHQFVPVDTNAAVRGFLDHWRPDLAVWIESELWPRLITETAGRGVPLALVNARLSARSARRWRRLPGMARALLLSFRSILAQDIETADRIHMLGGSARFAGNLKALVTVQPCNEAELGSLRTAIRDRPVWLAASTHEGEEPAVIAAHRSLRAASPSGGAAPLLILAPRHPERGDAVAALVAEAGLRAVRRSAGAIPDEQADVWLADTLGEMGLWYRLAPVAFVGGSLVPVGGHTPFEPVQLSCAVVHGPHIANFAPAYAALDSGGGAVAISEADALALTVGSILTDSRLAQGLRERARAVHEGLKPDLDAIADELLGLVENR